VKSPYEILLLPRITERSLALSADGKYTFIVATDANKIEIAEAIEKHYEKDKIKVASVNTIHVRGKVRGKSRFRKPGATPKWKKAIITLQKGQTLSDFGV